VDRALAAAVALITAGVANLPAVYVLVAHPEDAAFAPVTVIVAGLAMGASFVGGLALEGRHFTLARVTAFVMILQAPTFFSVRAFAGARWETLPVTALNWFFVSALAGFLALVALHGVTGRARSTTRPRVRGARVDEPRP
jgi:hypothetical protein